MTLAEFRQVFHNPLIGNCGYNRETAEAAIASGDADLIAIGRPFISNPDADMSDWYSPAGAKGYTDFPTYEPSQSSRSAVGTSNCLNTLSEVVQCV